MKYLLLICSFAFCVQDTAKQDTVSVASNSIADHFRYIAVREQTIKKMDTLDIKFNKILELLNDSTKKK